MYSHIRHCISTLPHTLFQFPVCCCRQSNFAKLHFSEMQTTHQGRERKQASASEVMSSGYAEGLGQLNFSCGKVQKLFALTPS